MRYVDPLGLTKIRIFIETGAMWIDPEQPGRIPYIIPITSGKAESMNRPECSGKENEGPIPKGSYTVDVTQLSNPSKIRDLFNMRYGDWGDWNVPLIPDPETDTYGRRNFYLHGGLFPGSSGCVDFGGGIFGNSITDQLLNDMLADTSRKIKVIVR